MFLQHLIPDSPSVIVISSKRASCAPKSGRSPPKVLFLISSIFLSFFNIMICLSQLLPIFLWKDFSILPMFLGKKNEFPLSVGFLSFLDSFPTFSFLGKRNEFPLSVGEFCFFLDSFPTLSHLFGEEFFFVCKITKNMPKSFHLNCGKNNHYGLILNQQAMTVMAL